MKVNFLGGEEGTGGRGEEPQYHCFGDKHIQACTKPTLVGLL